MSNIKSYPQHSEKYCGKTCKHSEERISQAMLGMLVSIAALVIAVVALVSVIALVLVVVAVTSVIVIVIVVTHKSLLI